MRDFGVLGREGDEIIEVYAASIGRHHVSFHPGAHGRLRDGLSINGTWFEDKNASDTWCAETFADLTGMTLEEIEAVAG